MIGYIPARGGSKRVPRKNIRPLGGVPVIGRVIETLRRLDELSAVFVSTDDAETRRIAESFGARWLGPRAPELCDDAAGFIDLMHRDLPRHASAAGGDTEVLFALPTAALVPVSAYRDAIRAWRHDRPNILMSCVAYAKSPYWALVPDAGGDLKPLFERMVYVNSQDLPPAYGDAGLFYVFDADVMRRFDSHKNLERLQPYLVDPAWAVDVDTEADWDMLEYRFARTRESVGA